jgi:hypothetical protein
LLALGYRVGKVTPRGVEFYPGWDADLETFVEATTWPAIRKWLGNCQQSRGGSPNETGTSDAHGKGGVTGITAPPRSRSAVAPRWVIAVAILLANAPGTLLIWLLATYLTFRKRQRSPGSPS